MDQGLWQETVREDAYIENLRLCNRYKRRVCAKEEEGVSIVKGRERRGAQVHQ